jgi:hypothetical protein
MGVAECCRMLLNVLGNGIVDDAQHNLGSESELGPNSQNGMAAPMSDRRFMTTTARGILALAGR